MWYNTEDYPWVETIQDNYERIKEDYYLCEEYYKDKGKDREKDMDEADGYICYNPLWQIYGIKRPPRFEYSELPMYTPATWTKEFLEATVPNLGACGFSVFHAGHETTPHRGIVGDVKRLHMGLIVPEGDTGMTCAGVTKSWTEGGVFMFNDLEEHQAWNRTSETRVILIVDVL